MLKLIKKIDACLDSIAEGILILLDLDETPVLCPVRVEAKYYDDNEDDS